MTDLDEFVNDSRFLPYHGWHDEYRYIIGEGYKPAIQQNRDEFHTFIKLIQESDINIRSDCRCLQIGLGMSGAAHYVFEQLFNEVWTLDCDGRIVDEYLKRFPNSKHIMVGDSHDAHTRALVSVVGPFDLLFIDGDHTFEGVKADFNDYSSFVRKGGMIAFHDTLNLSEVTRFMDELITDGFKLTLIGEELGISYLVKE